MLLLLRILCLVCVLNIWQWSILALNFCPLLITCCQIYFFGVIQLEAIIIQLLLKLTISTNVTRIWVLSNPFTCIVICCLWLLLLFCVLYQQKKFSDVETSRPPTGHHRLAPIQDALTSNVSFCETGICSSILQSDLWSQDKLLSHFSWMCDTV